MGKEVKTKSRKEDEKREAQHRTKREGEENDVNRRRAETKEMHEGTKE